MTNTPVQCPVCANGAHYEFSGRDLMFDRRERYDYFECVSCGATFQYPMPSDEQIAAFYPETYCVFSEDKQQRRIGSFRRAVLRSRKGYQHLNASFPFRVLAALWGRFVSLGTPDFQDGGKMLDVGCGNGRYLLTMRTLGWDVQGVEFSESGVRVCRQANLPVHHGDLESAAFPGDSFDLITVRHVIEHIPDPQPFMRELVRVLKPGGRLVIETPNSQALGRAWLGGNWYANDVPRHLILFSPDNLSQLARNHGLNERLRILETSPKIILNSLDYVVKNQGKPSKKRAGRRFIARLYVWLARRSGRGDTMQLTFVKP